MEKDYIFYRKKAGLDFDLYIKLHPEVDGEREFRNFMKRYDAYVKQRTMIVESYDKKFANERDLDKHPRIYAEKMKDIAQLELVFNDVVRVFLGLDPSKDMTKFGQTVDTRYSHLVEEFLDPEHPGLYIGADGLYRIACFYDDDDISPEAYKTFLEMGDKAYKADTSKDHVIDIMVDGVFVKVPEVEDLEKKLFDFLIELKKTEKPKFKIMETPINLTNEKKEEN